MRNANVAMMNSMMMCMCDMCMRCCAHLNGRCSTGMSFRG